MENSSSSSSVSSSSISRRVAVTFGHLLDPNASVSVLGSADVAGTVQPCTQGASRAASMLPITPGLPSKSLTVNPRALQSELDGACFEVKNHVRAQIEKNDGNLYSDAQFMTCSLAYKEQRPVLMTWIHDAVSKRPSTVSIKDMKTPNAGNVYAFMETWSMFHPSISVKMAVQYCLWGGSMINLSKRPEHEKMLDGITDLRIPGGFLMTEKGHGSNVRGLETTAKYDAQKKEFVIHTPNDLAAKYWIGGTANDALFGTVFARLVLADGEDKGVHAFLVPLRDPSSKRLLPGVKIWDCGLKMGLNGIDNGAISFTNVRVPRTALLNAFADVDESGKYICSMSPDARFGRTIGELSGGRVLITGLSVTVSKVCLAIATRYAAQRLQFGFPSADGKSKDQEIPILTYPTVQRSLFVPLARTVTQELVHRAVSRLYVGLRIGQKVDAKTGTPISLALVHALTAGLKATSSWDMLDTVNNTRQVTGGHGYRSKNRICEFFDCSHIFVTFEGVNSVLMQQVTRFVLAKSEDACAAVSAESASAIAGLSGGCTDTIYGKLTDLAFVEKTLQNRWRQLAQDLQNRLAKAVKIAAKGLSKEQAAFAAFTAELVLVDRVAGAYMEWFLVATAASAAAKADAGARDVLLHAVRLYAVSLIARDLAFFHTSGCLASLRFTPVAVEDVIVRLSADMVPVVLDIIEGFGIPQNCLPRVDLCEDD
eukprot:ANDGO_05120.mRNA.1 Acyl-coenzyme A oxidase 2